MNIISLDHSKVLSEIKDFMLKLEESRKNKSCVRKRNKRNLKKLLNKKNL